MAPRNVFTTLGTGAAAVLLAAAAAAPASADGHSDNGNSGKHYGQTKAHSNNGHQSQAGGQATGQASSQSSDSTTPGHNPPGNNGTVKIHDDYADTAHHNVPHVDCDFAVDFWGFDQGQTLDVSFAGQAPTGKGTPLTVTGAATSITSPDDAGGGQDYDGELDFRADQLNLSSLGAPQAKQGYHIKLTVDTYEPGGHKYKVFWLQPCTTDETAATDSGTTTTTTQPDTTTTDTGADQSATSSDVEGAAISAGQTSGAASPSAAAAAASSNIPTHVLGEHLTRSGATPAAAPAASSLPFTGMEIGGFAAAAALLLGSGTLLTVAARRRKRA